MPLPDLSGLTLGHEAAATQMGIAQERAAARWGNPRARRREQPNGPVDEKADRARAASVSVQEGELELADERRKSRLRHQAAEQRYKEILDASMGRHERYKVEQAAAEQMYKEVLDASERRHKAEQAAIVEQRGVEDMAYDSAVEQRGAVKKEYSAQKEGTPKGSPERGSLKAEAWTKLKQIEDDLNMMLDLFALSIDKTLSDIRRDYDDALEQAKAKFDRTVKEGTAWGS